MFEGREPIYVQIARRIRAEILAGTLPEEEQVMSTTQYATTYRINPATAAKAFAELVDEGLLYKRRGVGMFVAAGARDRLLGEHRQSYFTDVLDPALAQAAVLGIDVEELVEHITRTHPRGTAR
ncbi:GntR family transcriptional regulator [Georgenia yuyongxinii]